MSKKVPGKYDFDRVIFPIFVLFFSVCGCGLCVCVCGVCLCVIWSENVNVKISNLQM